MEKAANNKGMKREVKLSKVLQRELKGQVISKVSREIGLVGSLLHDWISGARAPSAKNMSQLKMVADHLGLTLEEILFDEKTDHELISSTTFVDRGTQYRVSIEKVKK